MVAVQSPHIHIRPLDPTDVQRMEQLYRATYREVDGSRLEEELGGLRPYFTPKNTLVASRGSEVVGFGVMHELGDEETGYMNFKLGMVLDDGLREERRTYFQDRLRERTPSAEPVVRTFEDEIRAAIPGSTLTAAASDIFFQDLVVDERYRRKGIGSKIAVARLDAARDMGAAAVYVACVEGSGTPELYRKLGFFRIVELKPVFENGAGHLVMGRLLTA